ncbi:DotU family type IV/VI secretion system protein [Psychrosphaera sp. G1-22]|uniref:DotU family type IV/VI secretion system protein n=1 Tax=Psychrosphaera algicola TaxID=3023714 RepID=A0ABT5FGA8_9GAMM|nr:DotU family type IV/VI secretion system protein [Psychrosphaera sp. G1-22]MDC2890169.1 DotU family type IV/VI secretion system protein [Psychrosphaera sp. G1-22]
MRLVDCFIGSLSYTMQVVEHAEIDKENSYDSVRSHITSQLDSLLGFALDGGYTKSQYQSALFAVVTFIDEKLIASKWEHRKVWGRNLLQRFYFDTTQGGVEFLQS